MTGFTLTSSTSFGLGIVSNLRHRMTLPFAAASNVPTHVPAIPDEVLAADFAAWSDESLDWAHATFDAVAETWPAE
ncbi:hypothetical protein AB0I55_02995 [Actinocatenispora sera]|uniref:hypothetical protein n=1 Tax=Actinocatenispora sera TaxID=390989 RepID=UPI0033FA3857